MLKNIINKIKIKCAYIIDDIKWDIVDLYMHTWLWNKIGFRYMLLKRHLKNADTIKDAIHIINIKAYRYIPKSLKYKLVNEKFK